MFRALNSKNNRNKEPKPAIQNPLKYPFPKIQNFQQRMLRKYHVSQLISYNIQTTESIFTKLKAQEPSSLSALPKKLSFVQ